MAGRYTVSRKIHFLDLIPQGENLRAIPEHGHRMLLVGGKLSIGSPFTFSVEYVIIFRDFDDFLHKNSAKRLHNRKNEQFGAAFL